MAAIDIQKIEYLVEQWAYAFDNTPIPPELFFDNGSIQAAPVSPLGHVIVGRWAIPWNQCSAGGGGGGGGGAGAAIVIY